MQLIRNDTDVLCTAASIATYGTPVNMSDLDALSIQAVYTDATPAAKTCLTGDIKETTLTFPAKSAATGGDYVALADSDGDLWGIALQKTIAVADVKTVTFPDKATAVAGDFLIMKDTAGTSWGVALNKKDIETITFPAKIGATAGDYIIAKDTAGNSWAVALNVGGSDPAPSGALYVAIPAGRKVNLDVSAATDAESMATACVNAFKALSGFTAVITAVATSAGASTFTAVAFGTVAAAVPKNTDDSGAGSVTRTKTVTGGPSPAGTLWAAIASGKKAVCDISACSTAISVAAAVELVVDALSGFTALIVTSDSAADGTMTFTSVATGPVNDYVPKNVTEATAGTMTIVNTTPGTAADAAPTGAIWATIAAGKKVFVDISAATDAPSVVAIVEPAFDALTGATTKMVTTPSSGTIKFTREKRTAVVADVPKSANDSGAGSITTALTTAGVLSAVDITDNTFTTAAHGYPLGLVVQLSISGGGTLPSGVTTTTNYYIIPTSTTAFKFAASLVLAQAGTAIDITDQGTAAKTITVTPTALGVCTIKCAASDDGENYVDLASMTTGAISAAGTYIFHLTDPCYKWVRAYYTPSVGALTAHLHYCGKRQTV